MKISDGFSKVTQSKVLLASSCVLLSSTLGFIIFQSYATQKIHALHLLVQINGRKGNVDLCVMKQDASDIAQKNIWALFGLSEHIDPAAYATPQRTIEKCKKETASSSTPHTDSRLKRAKILEHSL